MKYVFRKHTQNNRLYRLTMLKTHKHTATAQNSPVKEICAHTEMMQIQKHINPKNTYICVVQLFTLGALVVTLTVSHCVTFMFL